MVMAVGFCPSSAAKVVLKLANTRSKAVNCCRIVLLSGGGAQVREERCAKIRLQRLCERKREKIHPQAERYRTFILLIPASRMGMGPRYPLHFRMLDSR